MLVVDSSVIAPALVDGGTEGAKIRSKLRGQTIACPDLLRVEVLSVVRRLSLAGTLTADQAEAAIGDLFDLPLTVFATAPLLGRAWALRANVTAYDGCYVALAEALDCPLFTADRRLARAPGLGCEVQTP